MGKVEVQGLTKSYDKNVAVQDLNLIVPDGEFMVLLGPSGCGKTTTLRCIAGLEKMDNGSIYIADKLVNKLPPKDRNVAMVFQNYALYPHMKIYDNMAFPLKMRHKTKQQIAEKVKEVSELLGISHLLERKPRQVSGGEQQRVALGRAIIRNPEVFLMDEPLSNLDAQLRLQMRTELKRLQRELRVTTIFVTHDQAEAMTMADKIAIFCKGELQQIGKPEEVFDHPDNVFVARFLGSPPMNLVKVNITERNDSVFLDGGTFMIQLSSELASKAKEKGCGSELTIGIRPSDIKISKVKRNGFIQAVVYSSEPLGEETITSVELGENIIRIRSPSNIKNEIGDKIWISLNLGKIHFFDKDSKKCLKWRG